ncbi:hypothetical protein J4G43_012615 [Bradyrhizobium barranii subsp. barranii]|uniref:Uncharacterized protein n=1 Tax=Bradyrhizobium barranii subsp. barranii TaxID=2823807 RepID=A0A939M3W8_9BRAD|nr:hypothetical protein [Bradyrhizobium barranii]UEM14987.1 hypothetical protein J4G43_012615 [Bradyrhizobium barranii subsp. barranii]
MQIAINTAVLKSVHAMTEEEAGETIGQTRRVRINEDTLIEPERQKDEFTVEAPNLDDGLLFINLIDVHGASIADLAYDLKAGKFRRFESDTKPAASAKANPQADPGRDLGLALQIGNRTAVTTFLKHHPKGFYADLAKAQLEKIETEEAAAKKP